MPRQFKPREVLAILRRHGFVEMPGRKNDHVKMRRGAHMVVVPDGKRIVADGTLHDIIRRSGLPRAAFFPHGD